MPLPFDAYIFFVLVLIQELARLQFLLFLAIFPSKNMENLVKLELTESEKS